MGSGAGRHQRKYRSSPVWTVGDVALERAKAALEVPANSAFEVVQEERRLRKGWKRSRRVVLEVLAQQTIACNEQWTKFETELRDILAQLEVVNQSQDQVRSMLIAAVMIHDSAQLGVVMRKAASVGLRLNSKTLYRTFESLMVVEEIEGMWRCLASALDHEDVVGLGFWLEVAKEKNIHVPTEVLELWISQAQGLFAQNGASAGSMGEDAADYNAKESFKADVEEAYHQRDLQWLQQLVFDAECRGLDPGVAAAHIAALMADADETLGHSDSSTRLASRSTGVEAGTLRRWSVFKLKTELLEHGVDVHGGICEKEELVQLLLQVQYNMQHMPSRTANSRRSSKRLPSYERSDHTQSNKPENAVSSGTGKRSNVYDSMRSARVPDDAPGKRSSLNSMQSSNSRASSQGNASSDRNASKKSADNQESESSEGRRYNTSTHHQRKSNARCTSDGVGEAKRERQASGAQSCDAKHSKATAAGATPGHANSPDQQQSGRPRSPPASKAAPPRSGNSLMTLAQARDCLGLITASPTIQEVRAAYKKAALQWHPDRKANHGKEAEASAKFQEARTAFELLQKSAVGT